MRVFDLLLPNCYMYSTISMKSFYKFQTAIIHSGKLSLLHLVFSLLHSLLQMGDLIRRVPNLHNIQRGRFHNLHNLVKEEENSTLSAAFHKRASQGPHKL